MSRGSERVMTRGYSSTELGVEEVARAAERTRAVPARLFLPVRRRLPTGTLPAAGSGAERELRATGAKGDSLVA